MFPDRVKVRANLRVLTLSILRLNVLYLIMRVMKKNVAERISMTNCGLHSAVMNAVNYKKRKQDFSRRENILRFSVEQTKSFKIIYCSSVRNNYMEEVHK